MRTYPIHCIPLPAPAGECILELWPAAGAGVVLFYPGSLLSPLQYRILLKAMRKAGLAVAGLHLTGHGLCRHRPDFRFSDLLENGLAAERWLTKNGYPHVIVSGHSQGAILTLAHAAKSRRIQAAFPISAALPQREEAMHLTLFARFAPNRAHLQAVLSRLARMVPLLPMPYFAYLSPWRIRRNGSPAPIAAKGMRAFYSLRFLDSLFSACIPPRMHCPIGFFNAKDDALFTQEIAAKTFDALQAPKKTFFQLPYGGHLAPMNTEIAAFIAATIAVQAAGLGISLHQYETRQASAR